MDDVITASLEISPGGGLVLVLTLLVVGMAMLGMAVGVIVSGRRLKGSCGGIACGGPCSACPRQQKSLAPPRGR